MSNQEKKILSNFQFFNTSENFLFKKFTFSYNSENIDNNIEENNHFLCVSKSLKFH